MYTRASETDVVGVLEMRDARALTTHRAFSSSDIYTFTHVSVVQSGV